MYADASLRDRVENILKIDINDIVDDMDESKLDWAMKQVENTLKKKK